MTSLTMHKRRFPRGEKAYSCSRRVTGLLRNFWASFPPALFHVDTKHLLIVIGQETCSAITRGMPRGIGKTAKAQAVERERERDDARKEPRLIYIYSGADLI